MQRRKPLKRSNKPLKRSPLKRKAKKARVLKSGRVILDCRGMAELRKQAWDRSEGRCECYMIPEMAPLGCGGFLNWTVDHLHHLTFRSHGGSDTLENVAFIRQECHDIAHGKGKR